MKNKLTTGDPKKLYILYLLPTIFAMMTGSIYVIADLAFISIFLGKSALSAFNIAMPILTFYQAIGLLFGVGTATTMSVFDGMSDERKVNEAFSHTIKYGTIIAYIFSIVGVIFLEPLAIFLGGSVEPELLPLVKEYLLPIQSLSGFFIANQFMTIIIRADHNPNLVMICAIIGNLSNVFFDYLFVVELNMGLTGASLATGIGPILSLLALSTHYFLKKNHARFVKVKFDKNLFLQLIRSGAGTSILEITNGSIVYIFNLVLLLVSGPDAVSIFAIISNISLITKGGFNGLAQSVQPLISTNFGAKNYKQMFAGFRFARLITILTALGFYILVIGFTSFIMSFFIGNYQNLLGESINLARIYFIPLIFTGLNTVYMYYFQSTNNSRASISISVSRSFALILLGLVIFVPFFDELGVYYSVIFAEVLTFVWILPIKKGYDRQFKALN